MDMGRYQNNFETQAQRHFDSKEILSGAPCRPMAKAKKATTHPELEVASRLVRVRGLYQENQAAFARRLDISLARWNNFERGSPLSHQIAVKLVRLVPGLTLDWLYLGKTDGLTVDLARRLETAAPRD